MKLLRTFNIWVFSKREGFMIEKLIVHKFAERCKFPVECEWNSEVTQNVQSLLSVKKVHGFFKNKSWKFYKMLEETNLKLNASERSKTSLNAKILGFFLKQRWVFGFFSVE